MYDGMGAGLWAMPILDLADERGPAWPMRARRPRIDEIQTVVAQAYGVTVADLRGVSRKPCYARPRQIAAMLCREMTECSYPTIARHFGGRDHTTILFAYRKFKRQEQEDAGVAAELQIHRQAIAQLVAMRAHPAVIEMPRRAEPATHRWALRNKRASREVVSWRALGGELEAVA